MRTLHAHITAKTEEVYVGRVTVGRTINKKDKDGLSLKAFGGHSNPLELELIHHYEFVAFLRNGRRWAHVIITRFFEHPYAGRPSQAGKQCDWVSIVECHIDTAAVVPSTFGGYQCSSSRLPRRHLVHANESIAANSVLFQREHLGRIYPEVRRVEHNVEDA